MTSAETPFDSNAEPTRSFGRYQIIRRLGEGAMGQVFLARDTPENRTVALKQPTAKVQDDEKMIRRFMQEAQSVMKIDHPNVCPVYDYGEIDGQHYLTMPLINGVELNKWMQQQEEISTEQALRIVQKIARGLHAAHAKGIIHRDLKPSNIMMTENDEPIIMDFGMARVLETPDGEADELCPQSFLTPSGAIVGTPAYMSPEQILAEREKIGPPSDLYSLGVVAYELITGWPPFSGSLTTMLGAIVSDPPPEIQLHSPDLPADLNRLCLKALEKEPQQRYQSGDEFALAIEDYLAGKPMKPGTTHPVAEVTKTDKSGIKGFFSSIFGRK